KDHVILFFGIPPQIHEIADFLLTLLVFRTPPNARRVHSGGSTGVAPSPPGSPLLGGPGCRGIWDRMSLSSCPAARKLAASSSAPTPLSVMLVWGARGVVDRSRTSRTKDSSAARKSATYWSSISSFILKFLPLRTTCSPKSAQ